MNLLVISYYDGMLAPMIKRVCEETGWNVTDWFSAHPADDEASSSAKLFPKAVIHLPREASRGIHPKGDPARQQDVVLDEPLLKEYAPLEQMFMRMLDIYDPDGRAFTSRERREAYYCVLQFGLRIIRSRRPDLYVAGTIPHSLHDYLLYWLCRHERIPTLTLIPLTLPGYLIFHRDLENGSPSLRDAYAKALGSHQGDAVQLSKGLEEHYLKLRSSYAVGEPWCTKLRDHSLLTRESNWLTYLPNPFDRNNYARDILRQLKRGIRALVNPRAADLYRTKPLEDFLKEPARRFRDSVTTQQDADRIFKRGVKVKRALLKQYRRLQVVPDLTRPFIFVALHYQPEASTSPVGGVFLDQLLMLRMIARSMPDGWTLYVKEHRTTFDPQLRGHFARDEDYYDQIAELRNTRIVPMAYSSFDLIEKAVAVATVTGTVGWEAVVRGKPVMVFGNAWYKDCHGVWDCRSHERCDSAMRAIETGFSVDQRKVRLFIQTVSNVAVYADRDYDYVLTDLTKERSQEILGDYLIHEAKSVFAANGSHAL